MGLSEFIKNEMLGLDDFKRAGKYASKNQWKKAIKSAATGTAEIGLTFTPVGGTAKIARTAKYALPFAQKVGKASGIVHGTVAGKMIRASQLSVEKSAFHGVTPKISKIANKTYKSVPKHGPYPDDVKKLNAMTSYGKKEKTTINRVSREVKLGHNAYAKNSAMKAIQKPFRKEIISKKPYKPPVPTVFGFKKNMSDLDVEFLKIAAAESAKTASVKGSQKYYAKIGQQVQKRKPKSKIVRSNKSVPDSAQKDIKIGRAYVAKHQPKHNKVALKPISKPTKKYRKKK